ncbi:hypothetical protein FD05_GL001150 [Lentilactobacillus otakiensis DSM 19908 = JCM 15040]|uniref:Uncharacterized protein n=1 Tax=Lentilactobacillus otakiensis DSM 19908 = JCM 15040 TaxID=1423780 RepID=S4NFC2_9LACO|nr:hypothetical protein FD05_GL001150 [Lentilactobacillus otakiensis DSM 19908 = JCM 15040]GAD15947.1 hypothetical protein LOT_0485 [Lentilactobacillus otakiensis DSM 19908 = JCM 15040]
MGSLLSYFIHSISYGNIFDYRRKVPFSLEFSAILVYDLSENVFNLLKTFLFVILDDVLKIDENIF